MKEQILDSSSSLWSLDQQHHLKPVKNARSRPHPDSLGARPCKVLTSPLGDSNAQASLRTTAWKSGFVSWQRSQKSSSMQIDVLVLNRKMAFGCFGHSLGCICVVLWYILGLHSWLHLVFILSSWNSFQVIKGQRRMFCYSKQALLFIHTWVYVNKVTFGKPH